ncbi:MAG: PEP-CTERM sorting domain-containing protein [Phycisphaerales bacterium]|nr:MAG: PEP-CTERM sorting domain-containing protein [Phycisphaerales bacterium]
MTGKSVRPKQSSFSALIFAMVSVMPTTALAIPVSTTEVYNAQEQEIGTMQIDKYTPYKIEWLGGVEINGEFLQSTDLNGEYSFHFVQSLNIYDGPTPKKYADGAPLDAPFIDTPPGGYLDDPFDHLLYYDESEFPAFYAMPSTFMLDAQTEQDRKLRLSFETWLVFVDAESFGQRSDRASDDSYTVAPLQGWTWGYSITYADDGNGTTNLADFTVAGEPFTWIDTPSADWLAALDKSYGLSVSDEDWFDVEIIDCDGCIPEPATLALLAVGILMLSRSRAQT